MVYCVCVDVLEAFRMTQTEKEKDMSADLQVGPQSFADEFGILIYDIPEDNLALWRRIQSRIRRCAIRLNLSVYLFRWSMKEELEKIIEAAKAEVPNQTAVVFAAKFDNSSKDSLNQKAKECLIRDIHDIGVRLLDTVVREQEKAQKQGKVFKFVREPYLNEVRRRLEEAKSLAFLFGLTHEVSHAIEATQKLFAAEMTKLLSDRQARRAEKKAVRAKRKAQKVFSDSTSIDNGAEI